MLNNLRWLARQKSDLTEEAILRLSEMMRYMLYQVDQGPVRLDKEIDYINHYVEIQKIRLAPNNHLQFDAVIDNNQLLIEPLLFIHFIDNACKHGLHNELKSTVSISLQQQADTILFTTRNPINRITAFQKTRILLGDIEIPVGGRYAEDFLALYLYRHK